LKCLPRGDQPTRWSCLLTDHIQIHLDRHLYIGSVTETNSANALVDFAGV
jgi:hypothetical protein